MLELRAGAGEAGSIRSHQGGGESGGGDVKPLGLNCRAMRCEVASSRWRGRQPLEVTLMCGESNLARRDGSQEADGGSKLRVSGADDQLQRVLGEEARRLQSMTKAARRFDELKELVKIDLGHEVTTGGAHEQVRALQSKEPIESWLCSGCCRGCRGAVQAKPKVD